MVIVAFVSVARKVLRERNESVREGKGIKRSETRREGGEKEVCLTSELSKERGRQVLRVKENSVG